VGEEHAQALLAAGDTRGATTWVLQAYGEEVCGYLLSLVRDADDAADAFATAAEQVFVHISRFRGESSLRTWFYRIARNAALADKRRAAVVRGEPLADFADILEATVRSVTLPFKKTEVKDAISELRECLTREDRELLVLRVDRNLSWQEVALVLLSEEERDPEALKREAARARKHFERVKARLRELANEAGLLD
jgi:RNA polymerase sigma-70 factor (ECF subfamily)